MGPPIRGRKVVALYRKRAGAKGGCVPRGFGAGSLSIQLLEGSRSRLRRTRQLWELLVLLLSGGNGEPDLDDV